ncbi:unnamed protein product [Arctia plantaginis]|uniref:Uncharacterized protein n=1 Tax=Arctia plantaginis TaxID=874455 RepID=A0A8S1AYC4_ARCPL|nr:unnamed protein product [Arctia plantaginis]
MAAKFVVLALLVAAAQGSAIHGHGADYTSFSYGVSDPHTDYKKNVEKRQKIVELQAGEVGATKKTVHPG